MTSLREEVKATNTFNLIAHILLLITLNHNSNIASLGVNIATDIDNTTGFEVKHLAQEIIRATLARRVNDEQSLVGRVRDILEENSGISGSEACVGELVCAGVVAC